eukprot:CAMPEP_0174256456 /NCGR_PEP_ID=MMETSP0439-20130205/5678_1 /TAXON_ID=0 /ORGANISM="Stereomyxa ramosa, Strain Chinc5" /LENGTH=435 /DNA_ID=CAMNT_0015339061 /DNA_START=18 /DNA_END=1325 /DNA_ORIENTATION=-
MKGPLFLAFVWLFLFFASSLCAPYDYPIPPGNWSSGYLLANKTYGANLFYWLFDPQDGNTSAPVVVWLQGGPGCSGMIALFQENGPFHILETNTTSSSTYQLTPNPFSWNKFAYLLYIDNPAGTGFSYVTDDKGYVTTEQQMAQDLYTALADFYSREEYAHLQKNDLYIFGESYGGKYIPAIAYEISQRTSGPINNLKGIGIGDGFTDPITQILTHGESWFNFGLIDEKERKEIEELVAEVVKNIEKEKWKEATEGRNKMFEMVANASGDVNLYDFRTYVPYDHSVIDRFLAQDSVKKQLGVGDHEYGTSCKSVVKDALENDICKSMSWTLPTILSKFKVLLYQGQFDARDGVASNEAWIREIDWPGKDEYLNAEKQTWKITKNGEETVAGYVRSAGDRKQLTQLMMVGAGHLAPMNQPESSLAMLDIFLHGQSW